LVYYSRNTNRRATVAVYEKMNPEWKEKWVEALESGEYEQGQGCLNGSGKFCCLGVLCDLYDADKWGEQREDGTPYDGMKCVPEQKSIADTGLPDSAVDILWRMNDCTYSNFRDIAQWIREHL
jgi:hypothetical protein